MSSSTTYAFWNTEARATELVEDLEDEEKLKKATKTNVDISTRRADGEKNELSNVPKLKNSEPMVSFEIFVCSLFKLHDVTSVFMAIVLMMRRQERRCPHNMFIL